MHHDQSKATKEQANKAPSTSTKSAAAQKNEEEKKRGGAKAETPLDSLVDGEDEDDDDEDFMDDPMAFIERHDST